ncbi:ankyrin repeat domain-containing protein 35 isoform X2 [Lepisosteus oculatus]|uniref:ankyrin repeat domain-containing protein 35 isoform X2 n=1 Tax=Lepisosteus oculatus TaxID=7918 RepID=UPI0037217A65
MKRLFSCSAAPSATERWGKDDQKLLKAVDQGDVGKISAVLSRRSVRPTKLDEQGRSSFHLAASRGIVECLDLMLGQGVDTQARDTEGCSALHLAARYGQPESVKTLLQHNVPVDLTDNRGRTALHHAAISGCVSSVSLLCEHGVPLEASDQEGSTALMLAAAHRRRAVCEELARRGARLNAADGRGRTPLMLAAGAGCLDTVAGLLKLGADPTPLDQLGRDAVHYAREAEKHEISGLLSAPHQVPAGPEEVTLYNAENTRGIPSVAVEPMPGEVAEEEATDRHLRPRQEESREAAQLRRELSLRGRRCETLAREVDALRGRLRQQAGALQAVLEQEGEGGGEGEAEELLERLAALLRERRGSKGSPRRPEDVRREVEVKRRKKRESVEEERLEAAQRLEEALEGKSSAERRLAEIEGHLENMRAVLGQYETRKRMQSTVIADLEGQISESAVEKEALESRLQELERTLQEERQRAQGSVPGGQLERGRQVLGGTIAELRALLREVRQSYREAVGERVSRRRLSEALQGELDRLKGKLGSDYVSLEDHQRCKASWETTVQELERLTLKLTAQNQRLRGELGRRSPKTDGPEPAHPRRRQDRSSRPVSVGDFGNAQAVPGQMRPWKSEKGLWEGPNGTGPGNGEKFILHGLAVYPQFSPRASDLRASLGPPTGAPFPAPGGESGLWRKRMGRIFQPLSPESPGGAPESTPAPAGSQDYCRDEGQRRSPTGGAEGELAEEQRRRAVSQLEEDLAGEKEVSGKLRARLERQDAEIRALGDCFPPDPQEAQEEGGGDGSGTGFQSRAVEALFVKVRGLVQRHQEAQAVLRAQAAQLAELAEARRRPPAPEQAGGGETISRAEHQRAVAGLERELGGLRAEVEGLTGDLGRRKAEVGRLQAEVRGLEARGRSQLAEAEGQAAARQGELRRLSAQCEAARREAAEERRRGAELGGRVAALEARLGEREREARGLMENVLLLRSREEKLSRACQDKTHTISVLQSELETLSTQTASLREETRLLREQIQDVRKQHRDIVSVYRTHLLSAAQGMMDEEVYSMLLCIHGMQREAVC